MNKNLITYNLITYALPGLILGALLVFAVPSVWQQACIYRTATKGETIPPGWTVHELMPAEVACSEWCRANPSFNPKDPLDTLPKRNSQ